MTDVTSGSRSAALLVAPTVRYRLAWRHRWVDALGSPRQAIRGTEIMTAAELVESCRSRCAEAVGGEFLVTLVEPNGESRRMVHGADLASWKPVTGQLPTGAVQTFWALDEDAESARWRIYAQLLELFEEARGLRIVGRRQSRDVMRRIRGLMFDQVAGSPTAPDGGYP